MARTQSDYKKCKICEKSYKLAWYNDNQKWKLVKALLDKEGNVIRDSKNQPVAANPITKHVCGSADGFGNGKDPEWKPFDVEEAIKQGVESKQEEQKAGKAIPAEPNDLAGMIAKAVGPFIKSGLDEDRVRRIAEDVVNEHKGEIRQESILLVKQEDGEEIKVESYHPNLPRLIRVLNTRKPDGHRLNVYLYGKPGSGKTSGAFQAFESMGLSRNFISLNPQTADSRLNGFLDATGTFRDTAFFRAYTAGEGFCIDEIDNANDNLLTSLNSALDNSRAAFPNGNHPRHQNFALVVTANTAGRGGDLNHAGRRPLDAATLERFVFLEWQYDLALEEKLTLGINENAQGWLSWVCKVREFCKTDYPRLVVSPRASMNGAMLLKSGAYEEDIEGLAESVVFKGLDKETKAKILKACPLPRIQ